MPIALRLAFCLMLLSPLGAASQTSDPLVTVGFYKLDDQRVSGETTVIADEAGFSDLNILVTVDTAGNVVDSHPIDNFERVDAAPALALVRGWKFKPQSFDGKPVIAVGRVSVVYLKREIPPDTSVTFPAGDPSDTAITLDRSACFGSCPDYRVVVHGDGRVDFDTRDDNFAGTAADVHLKYNGHNVLLPGRHTARVDPAIVARLIDRFRAAHFFGLRNEYVYSATDNPTQRLTLRIGSTTKTVTDYIGTMAGMPSAIRDLEEAIDEAADTARWVVGNEGSLNELDAAIFDYRSPDGALLAAAVAAQLGGYRPAASLQVMLAGLIDRGVPLDAKIGGGTLGTILVRAAAADGGEQLFDKLAATGVLAKLPRSALNDAFTSVGCSSKIARALVDAGADPSTVGSNGTALTALRGTVSTCEDRPDHMLEMARTLIDLGVPLEARDGLGWTALMGCDSPELAQLLIARGANPDAVDKDGTTAVLATDDDRVALILLRAGANPRARDANGSVRAQAVKQHMPATLAWLDAHKIR